MSTQQDIYAAGFENRPPMLNKDNYVRWSSRLLRYAKSKLNGKLIYNSIMNGPYVMRMVPEPGDPDHEVPVAKTFHEQTDDELTEKEVKQMEADDQAIQIILIGLPEYIYAAVDSCETAQEIWLRVQQMMKGSDIRIQDKKAKFSKSGCSEGLIVVPRIANLNANQIRNGNVVAVRAEGNGNGNNGNQIRCYNCRGLGHLARNCTVRARKKDAAYLQIQLLIAQKEEVGIQLQAEEFDFMDPAGDLDEIEEVNANCILMANLQQALTSGTQIDKPHVYDSDGSAENDSNVISEDSSVEQSGGTIKQNPTTVKETRALYDSLYNNLAIEAKKVNTVNHKLKETNAELTIELARYKNQNKCFKISQEKYDKLERCYQKSVYQEQCLTKKINALHLSSGKQIRTLNEEITNLNNQLSKEKSTVSSLQEEKKKPKSNFKIRED
ncbi:retrovirus-related pol polyprotein from transposon TNT 1-94 [Tanacetum coccineum]